MQSKPCQSRHTPGSCLAAHIEENRLKKNRTTIEVASNLVRLWSFSTAIQIQGGCIYYLESAPAQSPETIPNTHTSNPFPTQIFFASSIPPLTPVLLICPSKDSLAHTRKQPTKPLIPRHIASMLWEDLTATAQTVMPPHPPHPLRLREVPCLLSLPTCTPALEPRRTCFL